MIKEEGISMIYPEIDPEAKVNLGCTEIRFDAIVTMYDSGQREITNSGIFGFNQSKTLPPQWFANRRKITLESIKYLDAYTLGNVLKDMYRELDIHIKQYENKVL